MPSRVDEQVTDNNLTRGVFATTTKSPDTGRELHDLEWFHQVVIRTGIEAGNAIGHGITRRQYQQTIGSPQDFASDHFAAKVQPVAVRQTEIKTHHVVGGHHQMVDGRRYRPGVVHGQVFLPQTPHHNVS